MRVIHAPSLADLTTLRLGGRAVALVCPESDEDVARLYETLAQLGGKPFMLGRGSNILAKDGELDVTLVRLCTEATPVFAGSAGEGQALVRVNAGCALPRLLAWCAARGFSGLEGLAGIPGEVGGALRMNAGSYGTSFTDRVAGVEIISPRTGRKQITREALQPAYRHTTLPDDGEDVLILGVELALTVSTREAVLAAMRQHLRQKAATQPVRAHSAGCTFANPAGLSAGRLLDELGFRGKQLGGMAFSSMHANFLINLGNGTSAEALELIDRARETVWRERHIELHLEVRLLPC